MKQNDSFTNVDIAFTGYPDKMPSESIFANIKTQWPMLIDTLPKQLPEMGLIYSLKS